MKLTHLQDLVDMASEYIHESGLPPSRIEEMKQDLIRRGDHRNGWATIDNVWRIGVKVECLYDNRSRAIIW